MKSNWVKSIPTYLQTTNGNLYDILVEIRSNIPTDAADITGVVNSGPVTSANITDATTVGKAVLTATDAASARSTLGSAATAHTHSASDITSGTISPARLGTGSTGNGTSFLADDGTYKVPPTGTLDPAAVASLADIAAFPDEPIVNGVGIASRGIPAAVSGVFACVDLDSPSLSNNVPFTIEAYHSDGSKATVGGTATAAIGAYRAIFPSTVTYASGDIITLVPGASGGTGGTVRHKLSSAWTIPSVTLNKPTSISVTSTAGVATVTWVAPTTGQTPQQYSIYRSPADGSAPYCVVSRVRGLGTMIAGHADGDKYAVEAVIPGLGSGLTLYYASTGDGSTQAPTFTTADSTSNTGNISTTTGAFIADASSNGSTAVYGTGGVRALTNGTTTASNQGLKLSTLTISDPTNGFIFKDTINFASDTTALGWMLFSSDASPITGSTTHMLRLNISNASLTVGAKAPSVAFGAGSSGAYAVAYKSGGTTTSTTIPAIGSAGVTFIVQFLPVGTSGAMTLNIYTATVANFTAAYPGSGVETLIATYDLTAAQVSALFGTTGSAVAMTPWEASASSSTTQKTINFGPKAAVRVGGAL